MSKKITKTTGLTTIPIEEQKRLLTAVVSSTGLKKEQLLEMYEASLEALKAKGVKQNIEHLAVNGVLNEVRKLRRKAEYKPKASATGITGFIIGDSGIWDKAETIRKTAKSYVDKHGIEAAIENNLINGDNQVLDSRKQVYGKDNPEYLKPLPEGLRLRSRTLYMITRINGDSTFKYTTLQTNDNKLALGWNQVRYFKMAQTFGIWKNSEEKTNEYVFNSSQAEETPSVFKAVEDKSDIDAIYMKVVTPLLTEPSKVESRHEATKDAWDRHVFVRGIVTWINRDRPTPWGSIYVGLMSNTEDGTEVRLSVPEHLPIEFGEQSEIIVLGKTRRTKTKDPDNPSKLIDGDVIIDVLGMYPIKGLTTPAEVFKAEALDEGTEIEGWLE